MENTPKTSVVNPVMTTGYKRFSSDKKGEVTTFNNLDSTILGKRLNQGIKEDDSIGEGNAASMLNLFRFAQGVEWVMLFFGLLVSWVSGACIPAMTILFGDLTDTLIRYGAQEVDVISKCFNMTNRTSTDFLNYTVNNKMTGDEFFTEIQKFGVGLSIIACVQFVLSYVMVACLNAAAERQVFRVRNYFLYAVLRQDIGWYDTHESGEFASRTADDITKLQDGIGEKVGMFNFFLSIFVLSIINAFIHGWKLTLVMLAVVPVMVIILGIMSKIQANFSEKQMQAYATAGAIAEESLAAIRTVVAFGGEEIKSKRYDSNLEAAKIAGIKRGMLTAFSAGAVWIILYATYALAFWYGIGLIISGEYIPSTFTIVFFSVFMGAMNMGQTAPYIEAFSQARAAAASIYSIIDRAPFIDSSSEEGLKPESINGLIEFEQISFNYPSRPEVEILENFNMRVNNGETLAIVGESGCGKSTTIQLLQRFYDPQAGAVKLDGCDIRLLNVAWLRNHIGIVGQEPVLFGTSIAENIKYGLDGATQEEVEWAAKEANAHNFIMKLPKKYDTLVGERGAQLSGGQKQRVAIARALIKNPRILLLDEATSALDSESEAVVQAALDKARLGRTTIIIAHRLSTIRNADKIAAFSNGRVAEIGTHEELMAKRGIYFQLATAQIYENAADDYETNMEDEINIDNRNVLERTLSMDSAGSQNEMDKNSSITKITSKEKKISLSEEEEEIENKFRPSLWKVLKQNSPEWKYIVSGCIGAIGMGFSTPVFSLIFGNLMGLLSDCDPNDIRRQSVHYAYIFLIIGAATAVAMFLQVFMFNYAGEYLTQRLRKLTFAAMLKQEVTWYDNAHNSVGVLCSRLSADAASVQGATGSRIGTILQAFCTLGASTIISLVLSWKMALVTMCFVPLVLASTYIQRIVIMGKAVVDMDSFDNANKIAIEAISNIRTVASLHKEKTFHTIYMQNLLGPHKSALKRSHLQGAIFGFAQSIPFFAYATSMFYGGYLVLHEGLDYENIFKVSQLLIMGTTMVGNAFAFAPNYSKGMLSAARIFKLLERKPLIDSSVASGLILPENIGCNVVFKNVKFAYPSRPNVQILEGLDLTIPEGKVVALVGSSGCGKSTCMHLLERFYDPISGSVTLENIDITALNIKWLRSQIGIVSQEPVLFNCSIYDNIAYGDNSRDVSKEEIIQAAKNANVHDFINSLPEGYETKVGDKGTQLSGGQKQRIAIARALLKKPKILLLDEATSALDTESERIVQEALEEVQKGRTCITVAHRLSTIRDADMIAVLHRGKVVEIGSHDQLISLRKHYFRFYKAQNKAHK